MTIRQLISAGARIFDRPASIVLPVVQRKASNAVIQAVGLHANRCVRFSRKNILSLQFNHRPTLPEYLEQGLLGIPKLRYLWEAGEHSRHVPPQSFGGRQLPDDGGLEALTLLMSDGFGYDVNAAFRTPVIGKG